jgi:hypothetical protein
MKCWETFGAIKEVHDGLAIPFDYYLQAHKKNIDYY